MDINATVRVRGPQDLLAFIPFRLGYQPSESVVVVSVRGRHELVGLVARLELDAYDGRGPDGRPTADAAAASLARAALTDGADRVFVVGYTGTELPGAVAPGSRLRRAVEATAARLEKDLPGTESWVVTPGGYRALDCPDPLCCPAAGRPADDITHSRTAASMVLAGRSVAASREERLRIVPATAAARRSAGRAAARWAAARTTRVDRVDWADRSLDAWRTAVRRTGAAEPGEPVDVGPAVYGKLAAALAERPIRDAVLLWLTTGDDDAVPRTARGVTDARTDAAAARAMAAIVDPDGATRPDPERVGPAVRVLEQIVAHVPRTRRVAPLTLLGLVAWWGGDGAMASGRIEAALALDGAHTLARLVAGALTAGLPPGWVRRETAALRREEEAASADPREAAAGHGQELPAEVAPAVTEEPRAGVELGSTG